MTFGTSQHLPLFSIPFITTVDGSPHMIFTFFISIAENWLQVRQRLWTYKLPLNAYTRGGCFLCSHSCSQGQCGVYITGLLLRQQTGPHSRSQQSSFQKSLKVIWNKATQEQSEVRCRVNIDQLELLKSHRGTFSATQVMVCCSALWCNVRALQSADILILWSPCPASHLFHNQICQCILYIS